MGNRLIRNIITGILLLFVQGLIINNMRLGANVNPLVYILFILLLPAETPNWLLLFLGFLIGISMDIFTNTFGLHASACVWLAFCRPIVLKYIAPRDGFEFGSELSIADQGLNWFLSYTVITVFLHHVWFFPLELFHFSSFFGLVKKLFLSSIASILLIVLAQYLMIKPRKIG